jgi:hypothetical protein
VFPRFRCIEDQEARNAHLPAHLDLNPPLPRNTAVVVLRIIRNRLKRPVEGLERNNVLGDGHAIPFNPILAPLGAIVDQF